MSSKYGGMTVNERLVLSGLIASFDKAIGRNDFVKAAEILRAVELDETNIAAVIDHASK